MPKHARTFVVPAYLIVTVTEEDLAELPGEPDPHSLAAYFQSQWDGDPAELTDEDGETVSGTVSVSAAFGYEIAELGGDWSTDAVRAALVAAGHDPQA